MARARLRLERKNYLVLEKQIKLGYSGTSPNQAYYALSPPITRKKSTGLSTSGL
jgi:hypothetical protein